MSKIWAAVFAALLGCVSASNAAPLEVYGRLPSLSDVTLSPDGTRMAFVKGNATKRVVVIIAFGEQKPLAMLDIADQTLRSLQWADNGRLLITTSTTTLPDGFIGEQSEFFLTQWFDVETKSFHPLFKLLPDDTLNATVGIPEPRTIDGHTVLFVRGYYLPAGVALFRVDLATGVTRMISSGSVTHADEAHADDWALDGAGNIVAESDYYDKQQHWKLRLFREGESVQVMDVSATIELPAIEGLSEDGSAVIIGLPSTGDKPSYKQILLKDGSVSPWQHSGQDFGDLLSGIRSGRIEGGTRTLDTTDYVFFDQRAQSAWDIIKNSFQDATDVDLVSRSDDWTKVVVHAFGPYYGDAYFLVDMAAHRSTPIGPEYDGISDVAPVKWIDYRAADGRTIHAYLTLPLNREAKNLPLIVLPHGGPHSRDEPGFDWISQSLASRGYVVLQPQFRGSDGFGYDLLSAGFGEFGRKMQTDLSDGVRALAAQGLIDSRRVCIVGASYGGYAALAGATLESGVYRCAVSIAGMSDMKAMVKHDFSWPTGAPGTGERFWDRFLEVKDADDPKLDAISPIKHIDKVSIPILLIHGRDDTVVQFSQSENMAEALKAAKKPYEFVELKGEDHWLSKSATRLQMLTATVKFLEANNPPN